jgi:hypothetical protein
MQYKGRSYRVSEIQAAPGKWSWTVRLRMNSHRTGIASSRAAAEEDVMKAVERHVARSELKRGTP